MILSDCISTRTRGRSRGIRHVESSIRRQSDSFLTCTSVRGSWTTPSRCCSARVERSRRRWFTPRGS